jgi:hypothetical protein
MKQTYSDKLKDPRWQKKRLEVLSRDKFKCRYCDDDGTELHVHHEKYTGEPWEAPMKDLITICKHCHSIETAANKHKKYILSVKRYGKSYFVALSDGRMYIFKKHNEILYVSHVVQKPKSFYEFIVDFMEENFQLD